MGEATSAQPATSWAEGSTHSLKTLARCQEKVSVGPMAASGTALGTPELGTYFVYTG